MINRHWIDKNCLPWSKDYLKENIIDTTYEDDLFRFVVTAVDSVSGDCDVTQRKGKVLCIYDMRLQFLLSGAIKRAMRRRKKQYQQQLLYQNLFMIKIKTNTF